MFKIPLSEIKDKIKKEKKLTEEEINERIKNKINELSGLISEEGAAHIIANELGIKIVEEEGRLKVKSIYSGMKNIEFLGKVVDKSEIREFNKGERSGKVGSFTIGDETGTIRAVCWNDQTDLLNKVNKDDLILIKSGYVKENNYNQKELHLNDRSKIEINPEGETIGEVKIGLTYERKKISDLKEEDNQIEILGTIVQVMD
ncbi:OB-fold nucleic acid binding domain-containing protein [Nanoarchaeota archaeon]